MDHNDPKSSFSTTNKGNHNFKKPLELEGLNLDEPRNNCLALIHAIKASDVENVKLLLENNCTANKSDVHTFDIPLHHAIEAGNLEIIELLLNAGASLLAISSGTTPLYKVMKNQQFDVVDLMLSKYNTANINPKNKQEFVHFVIACIKNNQNLVEQFIKKGIDVNGVLDEYTDEWAGHTPLYLSVKYLSVEVVEVLLKHQADFTFQDLNRNSPLHLAYYAWKSKNTDTNKTEKASDIMDLILAAHIKNINNVVNDEGLSHFHITCMGRNAKLVYNFLQGGVDVNSPVFMDPQSSAAKIPLHLAVEHCHTDIVKILLEHKADANAKDSNGLTPLQITLQKKLYKIAELLSEFKVVISTDDEERCNAIFQVFSDYSKTGKIIDMMFLACKENLVYSVNEDGLSLLHVACTRNNIDVIKKLLLTTPNVNACVHKTLSEWAGYTALHFAASVQNLDAIHVLLEYQADVNVVEGRGLTPLWLSLEAQPKYIKINIKQKLVKITESLLEKYENIEVVELLVKSKSNLNHKNNSGDPLLFAAYEPFVNCFVNENQNSDVNKICYKYVQESVTKIMDCLIEHGIDLKICDSRNNHILHIIARSASNKQCAAYVCSHYSCRNKQCSRLAANIAEIILKNGANVNVSNHTGATPLHLALRHKLACAELVECFLKFGADVDAADENQRTPLHNAVTYCLSDEKIDGNSVDNLEEIFDCLLGSNCNVNARDANGRTPLHIAADNRHTYCIERLLENGADINIKDSRNQSSIDALGWDSEYDGDVEESLLRSAFECLLWHVLKFLVIGHPVDPSHLLRYEPVANGKEFQFYYRDLYIGKEEDNDPESYYRGIFICEEVDNDQELPRGYNLKLREKVAELRDEVKKLKDAKIDDHNSLFDILGKNLQQMTIHVRNKVFKKQVCNNLFTRFPNYAYLLKLKFRDGLARDAILEKAIQSFQYLTLTNLPYICVDNIFSYISNKDMKNLVLATQ